MDPAKIFDVYYPLAGILLHEHGLNALNSIKVLLFQDIEQINIVSNFLQLLKEIVLQRDQTVLDFSAGDNTKANQRLAKNGFAIYDSDYLEDELLQVVLDTLLLVARSPICPYIDRISLQNAIFNKILPISGLKQFQSLKDSTMLKILQIGVTLARQPTPLQNDMIQSLLTYRNKYQLYAGKVNMQFEALFTQELQ